MYNTYKLMSNCTNSTYLEKELEELCQEYRTTNNVRKRNKIIAAMFCKVFPMILEIQKKYFSLTNEQKVEHALFHLVRSVRYYNGGIKFSSFFHTHLTNQMKTLLTSENSLKKAAFQHIVKDNDNILNWYTKNQIGKKYENSEEYMLQMIKNAPKLSSEEKAYCACVLVGYDKTQQIAEKLNLPDEPAKKKSNKKPKNQNINNISNPIQEISIEKQLELEQQRQLRRVRKIRQSIKEKAKLYGIQNLFC